MRWINKRHKKHRKQGHSIVKMFLQNGWNNDVGRYINASYSDLQSERKMEHLLLREQGCLCCYCMRTISVKHKTTLEHILPRKTKESDSNKIYHYLNTARFMKRYVKWTEEPPHKRIKVPPYPHYCAYENLVASCDGSVWDMNEPDKLASKVHNTCNNIRKDKDIIPMFFDSEIERKLLYERDGELTYDEEIYGTTIDAIQLEHSALKLMRKSWAKLAKTQYTIDEVQKAVNDEQLRQTVLGEIGLTAAENDFLQRKNIWGLFYEYRWFYDYFKYRRDKIKFLR